MSHRGIVQLLGLIVVALFVGLNGAYADTHTAASVAESAVQAAYDAASDGDTVAIPAGSATWTTAFVVNKAVTIQGAGIGTTTITDGVDKLHQDPPDLISPQVFIINAGAARVRLTALTIDGGTGAGDPYNKSDVVVNGPGTYWRIDHIRVNARRTCGFYIYAGGGVIDHCDIEMYGWYCGIYGFNGGGSNGDPAWADANIIGTNKPFFVENTTFNEASSGDSFGYDGWAGGSIVLRYNTFTNIFGGNHGLDSGLRLRSMRAMEVYNNTYSFPVGSNQCELRGGTGVWFNNTITGSGGGTIIARLSSYRDWWPTSPWKGYDGAGPWDLNDGSIYRQASHTGGNNAAVLTDSTANWTTNQWIGYSILNMSQNDEGYPNFSVILSNTATTITADTQIKTGGDVSISFNTGDTYRITRATQGVDQCGAGGGILLSGDNPTPVGWVQQAIEPLYSWNNTINGNAAGFSTASPHIRSGVHYFNNTPRPGYTPYTYPHPLVSGTNIAPYISAGPTCTPNPAAVIGASVSVTVIDPDFGPQPLSYTWTKASGPGTVTFGTPTAATSTVTFSATGSYVLQVSATDSLVPVTGTVSVQVNNVAPQITAGPTATPANVDIANATSLSVTATDPDSYPQALSYTWTKVSGPGTVNFGTPNARTSTATFTATGTYVLQADVYDGAAHTTGTVSVGVVALSTNLVAWWKLDETSGTTAADSSGSGNTGTLTNGPTWTTGHVNNALNFDGTNDYVDGGTGTSLQITGAMTVAAWVYVDTDRIQYILSKDSSSGSHCGWAVMTWTGGGGATLPEFHIATSATTTKAVQAVNGIPVGQWVHVAGVYDPAASGGPALKIYTAGVLRNTNQSGVPSTQRNDTANHVDLGQVSNGGSYFDGKLDDVRIYSRALADNEILALSQMVGGNQPPAITSGPTCTPNPAGLTGASVSVTATDSDGPSGLTYTWTKVSGPGTVTFGTPNAATSTVTFSVTGTYSLQVDVYDGAAHTTGTVNVTVQTGGAGPVAYWKLDETSGTTAADSSGNGNTGTLTNGPTWTAGKVNNGLSFDGTNDYVDCGTGTSLQITGAMTVATWVYVGADVAQEVVSKDNSSGSHCGWALVTWHGGGATLPEFHIATSATTTVAVQYGNGMAVGQWVHLAGVYEPSTALRMYINGSLVSTNSSGIPATQYNESTNPVRLGSFSNGGGPYNGKLDEVYVYPRVLTLAEIQTLAAAGSGNQAPVITAGPTCTPNPALLTGASVSVTATDSDGPSGLTYTWTKVSGPGTVTFGTPNAATSTVTFGQTGAYVLQIDVYDGAAHTTGTVNVQVNNAPPQITAGPTATPSTVDLPIKTSLSVTATDPNTPPLTLSYAWTKFSGPGTVTFGTATASTTTARFNATGTYVLRVTVTNSAGNTTGDVTVQVSTSNLAAYWKLDETSGTSAADCSGNSNTGTLTNGPAWTTGKVNGAVSFDGSNDYVGCGTGSSLRITGAMTVAAWVYVDTDGYHDIVSKDNSTGSNCCWALRTWNGGGIPVPVFQIATSATTQVGVTYGNGMSLGQWVHIAGVYTPSTSLKLYLNGSLVSTNSSGIPATQHDETANAVNLGRMNGGYSYFDGKIDEAVVYSRALSLSEIQALAAQP